MHALKDHLDRDDQDECMNCGQTDWCECNDEEDDDFVEAFPEMYDDVDIYEDPSELLCYLCGEAHIDGRKSGPMRRVVSTGVTKGFDPTAWYRLECGHTVI